jgi:Rieske 2Fe-2S family protein
MVGIESSALPSSVQEIISRQPPGHSLLQPFYSDPEIYRLDVERVWRKGWLFAGHSCEIPREGDFFTLEVDKDSILIVRGAGDKIHALFNVCRHRGSMIAEAGCGHVKKLTCPYHRWTYDLDGRLLAAPGMHEVNKGELGLKPVAVREVEGLIFISLAEEPLDFDETSEVFAGYAKPQGFRRAKVAKAVDYLVNANWKLVWENNRECYHCNANHPQYIKANFDHYNLDDTTAEIKKEISEVVRRSEAKWAADGLAVSHKQTGMTTFPDAERNIWYSANRTTLVDGYLSETMDGRQVAPLMGDYRDADVGTVRMRALPNFWNHSSCDHGVSTRLLPAGPEKTAIRVWWLVDERAVEGRDYDLAKLMPFWQLTSEQDWVICERQQRGVNSSAYVPGPYSTYKEYNVDAFVRWYLNQLQGVYDGKDR